MLLTQAMRHFARKVGKIAPVVPQTRNTSSVGYSKNNKLIPQTQKPEITKTGFERMDVSELQAYIDKSEDAKRSKELDMEILRKIESKSAKHYLQKTGIFSKGELKELAYNKYIEVNKKHVDIETSPVNPAALIDLKVRNPEKFILPSDMKLFLFFKPKDFVCTRVDPKNLNRPSIFDFIRGRHKISEELHCVVN